MVIEWPLEFLGHNITRDGYTIRRSYIEPTMDWPLIADRKSTS